MLFVTSKDKLFVVTGFDAEKDRMHGRNVVFLAMDNKQHWGASVLTLCSVKNGRVVSTADNLTVQLCQTQDSDEDSR